MRLGPVLLAPLLALLSAPALATREVLVVTGGYRSCIGSSGPQNAVVWPQLRRVADAVRRATGRAPEIFLSCFGDGANGFDLRYTRGNNGAGERAYGIEAIAEQVRRLAAGTEPARLHMIGHSHGGWLAMRTALDLPAAVSIATLVTNDPISYTHCKPGTIARFLLRSLVRLEDNPGCQTAAIDLKPSFGQVARRVGRWTNAYQTQFLAIHSSRIEAADEQLFIGYSNHALDSASHVSIEVEPRVWDAYQRAILSNVNGR